MKESNTAQRLKEIMKKQNLKQVDILNKTKPICKKYGIKLEKNDLSQYISGKVEPKQDKLSVLAEALNVNEAWLMGYNIYHVKTPEKELKKLDKFLAKIDYNNIDSVVKHDENNKILSYIDFYDLVLFLYSDENSTFVQTLKQLFEHGNNIYNIIKKAQENAKQYNIPNTLLPNELKLSDIELTSIKRAKLFICLRKKYSKKDILKEIDKRNIFKTFENENMNQETHLSIISNYIDQMMQGVQKKENN